MAVWLVRTGFTDVTLQHGIIVAGWDIDLSGASSYEDVLTLYQRKWPNTEESSAAAKAALLWDFLHNIKVDDLILMPRDWEGTFSVGRVTGQFQYVRELKPGARMTRPVRWLDQRVPVAEFDREIIDGLRPQPSIQEVRCHNADQRVLTVLERQPIQAARHNMDVRKHPDEHRPRSPYRDTRPSLESCAWNQIREAMWHAFPGAELLRLLDGLLKAQGFQQRAVVQAGRFPGLRLRTGDDILHAVLDQYECLPEELQAVLPLKRIWILALEEGNGR